jgi:hypothetical protein
VLITDYITPNCNREYSGNVLGDIPDLQLYSYSNAAFANSINKKLIFSYIYKLAGGPILCKLNKQLILTTLTTKAEYVIIIYAAKKAL